MFLLSPQFLKSKRVYLWKKPLNHQYRLSSGKCKGIKCKASCRMEVISSSYALHDHITTKKHKAVLQEQVHHMSQTWFDHDVDLICWPHMHMQNVNNVINTLYGFYNYYYRSIIIENLSATFLVTHYMWHALAQQEVIMSQLKARKRNINVLVWYF